MVDSAGADLISRAQGAARELVARGARAAIVTAGAAGLALAASEGERWFEAPVAEVRNAVGAGDALVAGLGCALELGRPLEEAMPGGIAAAAASVEQVRPGRLDPARVAELRLALTA